MSNRFGVELHPDSVRWAAAEGVSQDVIAAVLLLHERPIDEIVPQLAPTELEKVVVLVGRSPRLYARGMLEALEQRKSWLAPTPPAGSLPPKAAAKEQTTGADRPHPRHASYGSSGARGHPTTGTEIDANKMRLAHKRRLEMLRAHTPQSEPEPARTVSAEKAGTRPGTRAETIRRRFEVAQLMHLGLGVRTISMATGIPPTSVHRAKRAIARAEVKQEVAVLDIMDRLLKKAGCRRAKA
jgi:hypothetical protein